MNSKRLLRILIIAQWLLLIAAAVAGAIESRYLPQLLRSYNAERAAGVARRILAVASFSLIYTVAYLASCIALLRGSRWAKAVYVASAAYGFVFRAFMGAQVSTPVAGTLGGFYLACIGATIGVLLFSKEAAAGTGSPAGGEQGVRAQTGVGEPGDRSASAAEGSPKSFVRGLVQNLKAGLRAAAFLKVDPSHLSISAEQVLGLVAADLVISFFLSLAYAGADGNFNVEYLPSAVFYLPLMIIAAYWIASLESRQELRLSLPIAWISAGLWIETAGSLIDLLGKDVGLPEVSFLYGYNHYYRLFGWWFVSSYLIVHRLAGPSRKQAPARLVFLAVLALPFWFIPKWELWTAPYYDDADTPGHTIAEEEVFYAQPKLLERALSAIQPGRKGTVDLYFVGFGSDAAQDVFMKEIGVIKRLFDERFDTGGRSIALINNEKTVETVPIATRTALARTIRQIAARMNRDEDVLFLYLTSHGSEKHELLVDFWPLKLIELYPADIRKILDDAGITWRVVVVSACYSGGYIGPLKDDHTLVITSSDASNSSFGCSNDSDFTYFGKAYFDEALRKSHSFIKPFDAVREAILERERKGSETPSNPQISVGAAVRKQLEKLESRLESTAMTQKSAP